MKFYEIDNALQEAIASADKPVRLKIEIKVAGHFESVFEQDIIEANFYGLKEVAGGVSSRGELLLDNTYGIYGENPHPCGFSPSEFATQTPAKAMETPPSLAGVGAGSQVKVSFSLGEGLPYFQRFNFCIDDKGIQDIRGPGRKRYVFIVLRDLSYTMRKTDEARDWSSPAVFTYSVVCDKTQPEKSLVHGIALRAGLGVADIDCSTVPVTLPYVRLRRNTWAELSSMATAYRCHLECPVEKPLVFAHSPYQSEPLADNDYSYTFTGNNMYYLRKTDRAELYRNSVRLKVNMPVSLVKQEIWHYDDRPMLYDEYLQAHYPFKYPLVREIEAGKYDAKYNVYDVEGKERNVVYADQIDTQEEAENRLDYDGGGFSYLHYDVTSHHDKAILTLQKENDGDLYKAAIFGRPIVLDLNRSCFITDLEGVNRHGTVALNVTGSYFSEYEIRHGNVTVAQYEEWVIRELEERLQERREFTVKTHRAVFNARVGAKVKIKMRNEQLAMSNEEMSGVITAFSFRYRKNAAFVAAFKIIEQ
ncbi:MAG: hypothetical protein LBH43_19730 [Treponema sp.]|jgi:hypothetical protein|nr:hypothetical protein [Treponema sp.]